MLQLNSDQIDQLMAALAQAQGEILPAVKDSQNPYFKSKYADLSSISTVCRGPLSKAGLAVTQTMLTHEGSMMLVTTLGHSSGQWMRSYAPILVAKQDSQSVGSAITYMRRYSLAAMVGVVTDDDDGEASMSRDKSGTTYARPPARMAMPPKSTAAPDPVIQRDQAEALIDVLKGCPEAYRKAVDSYLTRHETSVYGLTSSVYEPLLKKALEHHTEAEMVPGGAS